MWKYGNFKGWIYTIALNLARNELSKKEYTYLFLDIDETYESQHERDDSQKENPETIFKQKEQIHSITNALGKLKPYLREVIIMKNYQHMKFREIAEATSIPEGTLKARYHRAIALLKKSLQPEVTSHV